jgi:hypothetical protein
MLEQYDMWQPLSTCYGECYKDLFYQYVAVTLLEMKQVSCGCGGMLECPGGSLLLLVMVSFVYVLQISRL